jgi:hypothetical protein
MRSKLLYEAPIWATDLMTNRRSLLLIRKLHRAVAIRIVREFQTVSATPACSRGYPRLSRRS